MREIKFRAYAEADKTWHYWTVYDEYPQGVYGGLSEPQQYTGVKDKNGVEMYDGDIVELNGNQYEVNWNESRARWGLGDVWAFLSSYLCEVVGNIFEGVDK